MGSREDNPPGAPPFQKRSKTVILWSGEVVAVEVHDFVPRCYKVSHELLLGVGTSVNFRQGPELGVRTEDEVHTGAGPFDFARSTVAAFKHVGVFRDRLPLRAHV